MSAAVLRRHRREASGLPGAAEVRLIFGALRGRKFRQGPDARPAAEGTWRKPGAQIAEDVAGRKRIARSGHKSVVWKFCCPSLLVHAFWFANKLAAAAFVQASIPLSAKPTLGCPLAQKERPAGWKSLPSPAIAWLQ